MAATEDPELASIVRALEKTARTGGEADVRLGTAVVRVGVEDRPTGLRMRAEATSLDPAVARELEVLGWTALERHVFRPGGGGRRRAGGRGTAEGERPAEIVDDVSRTWPIVETRDVGAVALDVLEAVEVIAGPGATGAVEAHHVSLGGEDAQYTTVGAVLGGLAIIMATVVAAAIRMAADYPQSLVGSLLVPIAGGAVVSWVASRIVLITFARTRGLRAQAEPTALVVGAIAPAVAIVAYTAAAIRLGLP